jgi:hypothetical protein
VTSVASVACELYVYYQLKAEEAQAARAAFDAARQGDAVRLLRRRDNGILVTWMEIYDATVDDAPNVEQRMARAMGPFVQGSRHIETFEPV